MSAPLDVIVIGAGASGLFSAKQLQEKNKKVVVVEAADYIGGRVKQHAGFVPWLYDVGGEIIHGEDTPLFEIAKSQGWDIQKIFYSYPRVDYKPDEVSREAWYIAREKRFVSWKNNDPDINRLWNVFYKLVHEKQAPSPNVTMLKYFVDQGVPQRVLGIADALLGKIWVTELDKMGAAETKVEEASVDHGFETNYRVMKSFKLLIDYLSKDLTIYTNWQAVNVSYKGEYVVVRNQRNETLTAKAVIVSVPIPVLRDGDIKFDPPLSPRKVDAIRRIGVGPALKIILKMANRFWPEDRLLTVCSDCLIPQIWTDGGPSRGPNAPYTITGYVGGDVAETLGKLSDKELTRIFLRQLDDMYGTSTDPTPATRNYLDTLVFDWAKMPFVRCGYSYPAMNSLGARQVLAENIHGKVFFCGEATTKDGSGTIAGALDTAKRVVKEVLDYFPPAKL